MIEGRDEVWDEVRDEVREDNYYYIKYKKDVDYYNAIQTALKLV